MRERTYEGENMFEKFTEGAIKVIMLAQEEARRMGHNFVGTEQLLLGVIGQRHGIGGRALAQINLTLKKTRKVIEKYIGRGTGFVASEIPFTPRAKRVLEMSIHEGQDLGVNYVGTEHILLSLLNEPDGLAILILDKLRVNIHKLRSLILTYIEEQQEDVLRAPLTDQEKWAIATEKAGLKTPALDDFTVNISELAHDNQLDPVIGREEEITDLIKVLGRRRKNNPVLVGEAGVGKTACVEGLAQEIDTMNAPPFLDDHIVRSLDLGAVLAGTKYRGEFEERMKRIIDEVKQHGKTILAIDEIHTLVGAGAAEGAVDAANLLKPALARGTLRCVGATTLSEYHRYIEKDPALERRFCRIIVEEPSVEMTINILNGLESFFERHHALRFSDNAFEKAAKLSARFISDRNLPDKAIDVIDEAGSRVRLKNRKLPMGYQKLLVELQETLLARERAVRNNDFMQAQELIDHEIEVRTHLRIMKFAFDANEQFKSESEKRQELDLVDEQAVAEIVSKWSGVPLTKINQSESDRLLAIEDSLHQRLIGQNLAVTAVSKAVRRARVGLGDPKRPIASFIFAGPTGVGKTELTKALAEFMFDSESNMIRLDMSEFMEKHTVAKLIGSPPGYVGSQDGGQLTEAVRLKPYSIVLFDEIEKAHPDIFNVFLQILDDGRLTDSSGKLVNFKNTIIVMTTNLGARYIEQETPLLENRQKKSPYSRSGEHDYAENNVELLVNRDGTYVIKPPSEAKMTEEDSIKFAKITDLVFEELKKFFRPEFLNRIDDIIVFNHLTKYDLYVICGLMISRLQKRMHEDKQVELSVDASTRYYLTEEGYNPIYGARPLRRAITKLLEDKLAEACLYNNIENYKGVHINVTLKKKLDRYTGISPIEKFGTLFEKEILINVDLSKGQEITPASKKEERKKAAQAKALNDLDTTRKYSSPTVA